MRLQLTTPPSTRKRSFRGGNVSPKQLGCVAVVVLVLLGVVFSGDDSNDTQPPAPAAVSAPVASAPDPPVEVPESSTLKPGFKNRRWGDPPSGMKYVGRGQGLTKYYEPRSAECIELGTDTICGITYHYFKKKLFAVTFEDSFITRGEYRPSLLDDLEAQWGPGTLQIGGRREWRSRDKKHGLTIATWKSKPSPLGGSGRWEEVRIWSDRIERERLKVEADPNSPEMRQLQKEIDEYQREQQRQRDRYKM